MEGTPKNNSGCGSSKPHHRKPRIRQVGRYRLEHKLLGKGNFARVELATHTILGLKVAVKLIDKAHITEDYVRRNLGREARIMARLRHPNIAALYEAIESGHLVCLVTELALGGDLCSFVKAHPGGRLPEARAAPFLRQIVSALSYMHDKGILHRDLKMENVMLDETQTQTKIVDFGLSNFYGPGVTLHTHCGSPEYAAPELFVPGKSYGPQVDVWSLGIIMYGALTGCLPFLSPRQESYTAQERRQRLYKKIQEGLRQNHWIALSHVSSDACHLLSCLLSPDPDERISLKMVAQHPFVTRQGRQPVLPCKEPSIHDVDGRLILRRLMAILNVPITVLEAEIERDDHCELAAMFYLMLSAHRKNASSSEDEVELSPWSTMVNALNTYSVVGPDAEETAVNTPYAVCNLPIVNSLYPLHMQNINESSFNVPEQANSKEAIVQSSAILPRSSEASVENSQYFTSTSISTNENGNPSFVIKTHSEVSKDAKLLKSSPIVSEVVHNETETDDETCRLVSEPSPFITNFTDDANETTSKILSNIHPVDLGSIISDKVQPSEDSMKGSVEDFEERLHLEAGDTIEPSPVRIGPSARRFSIGKLCFKGSSDIGLLAGDTDHRGTEMSSLNQEKESKSEDKGIQMRNKKNSNTDDSLGGKTSKRGLRSLCKSARNSCLCMSVTLIQPYLAASGDYCLAKMTSKGKNKSNEVFEYNNDIWTRACLVENNQKKNGWQQSMKMSENLRPASAPADFSKHHQPLLVQGHSYSLSAKPYRNKKRHNISYNSTHCRHVRENSPAVNNIRNQMFKNDGSLLNMWISAQERENKCLCQKMSCKGLTMEKKQQHSKGDDASINEKKTDSEQNGAH